MHSVPCSTDMLNGHICSLLLIALHTVYVIWEFLSDIVFISKTQITAEAVLFVYMETAITTFANALN